MEIRSTNNGGAVGSGVARNTDSGVGINTAALQEHCTKNGIVCYQLTFSQGNKLEEFVEDNIVKSLGIKLQKEEAPLKELAKLYIHPEKKWGKKRLYMKEDQVEKLEKIASGNTDAIDGAVDVINAAMSYTFTLCKDRLFGAFGNKPTDMAISGLDGVFRQGAFQLRSVKVTTALNEAIVKQFPDRNDTVQVERIMMGYNTAGDRVWGYNIQLPNGEAAMDTRKMLMEKFSWSQFAIDIGATEEVQLTTQDAVRRADDEKPARVMLSQQEQDDQDARTAMFFGIADTSNVTEEKLRKKVQAALAQEFPNDDKKDMVSTVELRTSVRTGKRFARTVLKEEKYVKFISYMDHYFAALMGPMVFVKQSEPMTARKQRQDAKEGKPTGQMQVWQGADGTDMRSVVEKAVELAVQKSMEALIAKHKTLVADMERRMVTLLQEREQQFIEQVAEKLAVRMEEKICPGIKNSKEALNLLHDDIRMAIGKPSLGLEELHKEQFVAQQKRQQRMEIDDMVTAALKRSAHKMQEVIIDGQMQGKEPGEIEREVQRRVAGMAGIHSWKEAEGLMANDFGY